MLCSHALSTKIWKCPHLAIRFPCFWFPQVIWTFAHSPNSFWDAVSPFLPFVIYVAYMCMYILHIHIQHHTIHTYIYMICTLVVKATFSFLFHTHIGQLVWDYFWMLHLSMYQWKSILFSKYNNSISYPLNRAIFNKLLISISHTWALLSLTTPSTIFKFNIY